MQENRRLAAILFTDIVGYTSMMQKDEQGAVAIIKRHHAVMEHTVTAHQGEVHSFYGDGCLCIFSSATEAVRCAVDVQQQLRTGEPRVPLRIGLHIGEIFFEGGKVMGDGVNIASRIQSLGQANSILFSKEIVDKLRNQTGFQSVSLGLFEFKNVEEPMEVFASANKGLAVPRKEELSGKLKEVQKKYPARKWIIAATIVALIFTVFLSYRYFSRSVALSLSEMSIAVLPFENTGAYNSEEYISDGITQDIINKLSKVSSLQKVIGWFSVKSFKKTNKSGKEIAKELGVGVLLTGTIQRYADKIRVIAELIDVGTNKRLWGNDYNYAWGDILSIQTEVAQQIVTALRANLSPQEKKELSKHYTENIDAYKFYRRGRSFWDMRTKESFDSAEVNYKRATQLDPDYALAYVGLADCYTNNQKGLSQLEAIPIARDYVNKALSLDSTLSEALTTAGFILAGFDNEFAKAKILSKKVISSDPNYPLAHIYYGNYLELTGESADQAIREHIKAVELDPLSISNNYILGRSYYFAGKLDLAYEQLRKTLILNPQYDLAKATLAHVLLAKKKYSAAFEIIRQLPKTGASNLQEYQGSLLSYAYAVSGDKTRAKTELEKTLQENPDQSPYHLARVYTILGNDVEALNQLERSHQSRELGILFMKIDPTLELIRNEPRFKALLKKTHLD
jgi:adenylate cyclase